MPVVILEHLQETRSLPLVVPHLALSLKRPAYALRHIDHCVAVLLGTKHLVKCQLACNGCCYLGLYLSKVVSDLSKHDPIGSCIDPLPGILKPFCQQWQKGINRGYTVNGRTRIISLFKLGSVLSEALQPKLDLVSLKLYLFRNLSFCSQ